MIAHDGTHCWPEDDQGCLTLREIGIGLGRTARFAGQTREWYPVLSHVFVVAALMDPSEAIHGLLHDAAEAVVGDVPTTWKTTAAVEREDELLRRVYATHAPTLAIPTDAVKAADREALIAEAVVLGHADPSWFTSRWGPPSPRAARLTLAQLDSCRIFLDADTAGRAYRVAVTAARLA